MQSELKYWFLHEHNLFKNLSFLEIDTLCILKRFKKSKKSEILDLPYSEKERIYFLKKGVIKLIRINDDGEEVLLNILQKGDIFGELGFEQNEDIQEFMKVVSDEAIICTFYREKLEELMIQRPDFAINYIKFIGFRFKKFENNYKNIFFKDAKTRLLLFINSLIEKDSSTQISFVIPSFITQKDIAQLICSTRQTVNILLKELENDGIIYSEEGNLVIKDRISFKKNLEKVI